MRKDEIETGILDDIVNYAEDDYRLAEDVDSGIIEEVLSDAWDRHAEEYEINFGYKDLDKIYKLYLIKSLITIHFIEPYKDMIKDFEHSL